MNKSVQSFKNVYGNTMASSSVQKITIKNSDHEYALWTCFEFRSSRELNLNYLTVRNLLRTHTFLENTPEKSKFATFSSYGSPSAKISASSCCLPEGCCLLNILKRILGLVVGKAIRERRGTRHATGRNMKKSSCFYFGSFQAFFQMDVPRVQICTIWNVLD